jgi:hypothetical protein
MIEEPELIEAVGKLSNAEFRRREREETDWEALEKFEAANRREFVGV